MNIFKGFKLDPKTELSQYEVVTISLRTDYHDGSGWESKDAKQLYENEVRDAFENAGYTIEQPEFKASCPILKSKEHNNKMSLYMHPQAYTGHVKKDEIDKIMNILKECSNVYSVRLHYHEPVYDISDSKYHKLILEQSKEIVNYLKKAAERGVYIGDAGFDFAEECRILRLQDGSGYTSDDIDVRTVNDITVIAEKTGLLSRAKERSLPQFTEDEQNLRCDAKNALTVLSELTKELKSRDLYEEYKDALYEKVDALVQLTLYYGTEYDAFDADRTVDVLDDVCTFITDVTRTWEMSDITMFPDDYASDRDKFFDREDERDEI